MPRSHALDLYDPDGRWLAWRADLTEPLATVLARLAATYPTAATYRLNGGKRRPMPTTKPAEARDA